MQIVSNGDNLHDMSDPVSWKKETRKKILSVVRLLNLPIEWYRLIPNSNTSYFWRKIWCFSKETSERDWSRRFSLQDDYFDIHLVSPRNKLVFIK